MKTSNKLILIALVIFLVSLGVYDTALKAEYLTGSYKDEYKDYTALDFKDFDEVEVRTTKDIDLKICEGNTTKVMMYKKATGQLKFTQLGRRLIIDAGSKMEFGNNVLISCPNLKLVTTSVNNNLPPFKRAPHDWVNTVYQGIEISGFTVDSLDIMLNNTTSLSLKHNKIQSLNLIAGSSKNAAPLTEIKDGNIIQKANIQIKEHGRLELNNVYIPDLKYHFSDSTTISFSGASLKSLNKQ